MTVLVPAASDLWWVIDRGYVCHTSQICVTHKATVDRPPQSRRANYRVAKADHTVYSISALIHTLCNISRPALTLQGPGGNGIKPGSAQQSMTSP